MEKLFYNLSEEEFSKGRKILLWGFSGLFFLGGISGGIMSAKLTHTIGAADCGAGIPFFNWSTVAGDIRMAHFFTLHGLQLIPVFAAIALSVAKENATRLVAIFTFAYLAFCLWLHWLALNGLALISV